ncbi:MAG: DUF2294 family protein [Candidatus Omnitrophica bacterium]|nr:DUF2294 family protein [Candidatus Omnitrophota bacterium]
MAEMTKGQIEASVSEAIIKFEKEYMGRGPQEAKTYILKDLIFVRLKGVLTPAEEQLAKTAGGAELIKKTRMQLLEGARKLLENIVSDITQCRVKSLHTDISTKTGERIIIFTLDRDFEAHMTA